MTAMYEVGLWDVERDCEVSWPGYARIALTAEVMRDGLTFGGAANVYGTVTPALFRMGRRIPWPVRMPVQGEMFGEVG